MNGVLDFHMFLLGRIFLCALVTHTFLNGAPSVSWRQSSEMVREEPWSQKKVPSGTDVLRGIFCAWCPRIENSFPWGAMDAENKFL